MASYIALSLLAALSAALATLISKFTSKHAISNQWVLLFYYYLTVLPFILLIPVFFNVTLPLSSTWPSLWLYGVIFFTGNALSAAAIYRFDSSTFAAFLPLRTAVLALLAFWFLREEFPLSQYIVIGIMGVGAFLTTLDERLRLKAVLQSSVIIIITQQVAHAVAFLFAGIALQDLSPFSLLFWGNITSGAFALLLIPVLGKRLRVSFAQVSPMIASGFFTVAASAALFTAFQSNLTISSAVSQLSIPTIVLILTVLASHFKPTLLEHHPPRVYLVRALGVALILLGALRLTLS